MEPGVIPTSKFCPKIMFLKIALSFEVLLLVVLLV